MKRILFNVKKKSIQVYFLVAVSFLAINSCQNVSNEAEEIEANRNWREFERSVDENQEEIENSWPKNEQEGFMNSCVENAMKSGRKRSDAIDYCDCSLYNVMKAYPDINDVNKASIEEIRSLAEDCK